MTEGGLLLSASQMLQDDDAAELVHYNSDALEHDESQQYPDGGMGHSEHLPNLRKFPHSL